MCNNSPEERRKILAQVDAWASEGLRLLGLAYRTDGITEDHSGYNWVGLVGMEDPRRKVSLKPWL